jgi:xanthine/CO dehydrogenase XdhC/CoxF family maturation factor
MVASDMTEPTPGELSPLSMDDDVLAEAARWCEEGRTVVLATVVKTWGSSPRPVGSHLAIDQDRNFVGSVSGGCIEGAVIHEALEVMEEGKPRILQYGVTHEMAWEVGLACGGQVNVYVENVE